MYLKEGTSRWPSVTHGTTCALTDGLEAENLKISKHLNWGVGSVLPVFHMDPKIQSSELEKKSQWFPVLNYSGVFWDQRPKGEPRVWRRGVFSKGKGWRSPAWEMWRRNAFEGKWYRCQDRQLRERRETVRFPSLRQSTSQSNYKKEGSSLPHSWGFQSSVNLASHFETVDRSTCMIGEARSFPSGWETEGGKSCHTNARLKAKPPWPNFSSLDPTSKESTIC